MADPTDDLARLWEWFGQTYCQGDSPLYGRLAAVVAGDRDTLELVQASPPSAHLPLTLLAAVHYLLLDGLDHPLADVYAGRSAADPGPLFLDLCRTQRPALAALLAERHVQTNDCGRSAVIGPGLTWLAGQLNGPLALVDVGASAGINLLCDRYRLDYGAHGATGPTDSPVHVACRVDGGTPPVAGGLPELAARIGLDRSPIDLGRADDARWLLACVWPDTGRLARTAASIALVQADPPAIVTGDAVAGLPAVLAGLPGGGSVIVVTTAAVGYLSVEERRALVAVLAAESLTRDVAWLCSEGVGIVEAFAPAAPVDDDPDRDVLGAMLFHRGTATSQFLGFAHKHGTWLDWRAPVGSVAT